MFRQYTLLDSLLSRRRKQIEHIEKLDAIKYIDLKKPIYVACGHSVYNFESDEYKMNSPATIIVQTFLGIFKTEYIIVDEDFWKFSPTMRKFIILHEESHSVNPDVNDNEYFHDEYALRRLDYDELLVIRKEMYLDPIKRSKRLINPVNLTDSFKGRIYNGLISIDQLIEEFKENL